MEVNSIPPKLQAFQKNLVVKPPYLDGKQNSCNKRKLRKKKEKLPKSLLGK